MRKHSISVLNDAGIVAVTGGRGVLNSLYFSNPGLSVIAMDELSSTLYFYPDRKYDFPTKKAPILHKPPVLKHNYTLCHLWF